MPSVPDLLERGQQPTKSKARPLPRPGFFVIEMARAIKSLPPHALCSASRRPPTGAARSSRPPAASGRSEEHTSELQSLMRISYAVFCLKKKKPHNLVIKNNTNNTKQRHTEIRKHDYRDVHRQKLT